MWLGTDVRCLERADIFAFTVEFIHISPPGNLMRGYILSIIYLIYYHYIIFSL